MFALTWQRATDTTSTELSWPRPMRKYSWRRSRHRLHLLADPSSEQAPHLAANVGGSNDDCRTPLDASLYNQHRELLANTLCRRMVGAIDVDSGEEMFGDAVFALPSDDRKRVAVETLLRYCNGDWRLDTIHHHCVPGVCDCRSDAEVVIHFHMS